MIEINNLTLNLSKSFCLDIKSLHIQDKEIFSVIGPNGAGKTTLLNILSLFENRKLEGSLFLARIFLNKMMFYLTDAGFLMFFQDLICLIIQWKIM